jgi:predicted Fe-Mo cluster-binding NifX family protein
MSDESPKRVAFCVDSGVGQQARLHQRYARCDHFVVVDRTSGDTSSLDNEASAQAQGAGVAATAQLERASVDAVVAHHYGPKALEALQRLGIAPYLGSDGESVSQLLSELEAGRLRQAQ